MAIDVYWGSGSVYSWRVLLALEHKALAYESHLLQLAMQEHKSPHMLSLNPRGRVPILKDGDYVVFESLAVLYYLDRKYPAQPLFGTSAEEGAVIMRVCCEYQAYIEPHLMRIVRALLFRQGDPHSDESTHAMHMIAGEARTIEGRLSKGPWIVGDQPGASDYMIYPGIKLLLRALARPEARELSSRFMPVEANYPALGRWLKRVEALPGYERTYPPHWRDAS
ncbi:MAG TPA: glutathione S-transferase family protein [Steroidobacteraceae bacterium]|nr:glutathione S-transferase family protein [Steroidobacteraceae bacterium]